jgi:antirestriction protein
MIQLQTDCSAFFYIDGIPTKGIRVELDASTTWEDIAEKIRTKYPSSDCDEILCADAEGFARHFLGRYDGFDLKAWAEWMEAADASDLDPEIVALYCDNVGQWDAETVQLAEENYYGSFYTPEDFAAELIEMCGELQRVPEHLRYYFDYEKYARDLLMGDFFEVQGHYFRNA